MAVSLGRRTLLSLAAAGGVLALGAPASAVDEPSGGNPRVNRRDGGRLLATFVSADTGRWKIDSVKPVIGESLPAAPRLDVIYHTNLPDAPAGRWSLRGTTSNLRYTTQHEQEELAVASESLDKPQKTLAALIPITKNAAWWALGQDRRRALFEQQSKHIDIGSEYLPAVSRRLYHGRDLGEPFDFLTWFEYAPKDSDAFETLVRRLRATTEWTYVDREVDIRLNRT